MRFEHNMYDSNNQNRNRSYYQDRYYDPNDRYNERYIRNEEYADNRYEYRGGRRVKKEKFPSETSLNIIKFFKLSSQVLYIVSLTAMMLSFIVSYIMFKTKIDFFENYYFGDASSIMMVCGSLLGIIASFFFFCMFMLLFFNRKGWLRKSKSYIPGLIAFSSLFCISVYVLYVSQCENTFYEQETGTPFVKYTDISVVLKKYIFSNLPHLDFLGVKQCIAFWRNIDTYLWITFVILIVVAMIGSLFVRSYGKTLDESEHFFYRRRSYY